MTLPTFPEFSPLALDDKEDYERLIVDYPPLSDISFATLHIWWNLEGRLAVSSLNGNLILRYHIPFDEDNSGVSLVGKQEVDVAAKTIFDHLRHEHKKAKLVHMPEFVVKTIQQPENFVFVEELDYNEYILDTKALSTLTGKQHSSTRWEINRFLREVENRTVEVKPLDLSTDTAKEELMQAIIAWEKVRPAHNDPEHTEHLALRKALAHASDLHIQHLGLYIDGKLHAVILYHQSSNKNYYIVNHLKVDYSVPFIFDYMTHHLAKKASQESVSFLNYEMDLGIENLRKHKMRLRPVDFFRKYTVTPA